LRIDIDVFRRQAEDGKELTARLAVDRSVYFS
jgi:hypothetical protein